VLPRAVQVLVMTDKKRGSGRWVGKFDGERTHVFCQSSQESAQLEEAQKKKLFSTF